MGFKAQYFVNKKEILKQNFEKIVSGLLNLGK